MSGINVVIKDFEFGHDEPLLLNGRVIEKRLYQLVTHLRVPLNLGNFTIAQINENQQRVLNQFQKVIMLKEAEWDSAKEKAEQAILDAEEAFEVAQTADSKAETAQTTANQAFTDIALKLDESTFQLEKNAIIASIGEKVGLEYLNGVLVDKANVSDTVTKTAFEETLLGYVTDLTYTTDQNGFVERLQLEESNVSPKRKKDLNQQFLEMNLRIFR